MTLSTEVAEAVRLRDAATPGSWAVQDSVYVVAGCWPLGSTICEVIENEPNAALIAAAPSHVDLIERLAEQLRLANINLDGYAEEVVSLRAELDQARADGERLTNALQKIERWFGEFPTTGEFWADIDGNPDPARPMTYGAKYGSNGERDYMRSIARSALKP